LRQLLEQNSPSGRQRARRERVSSARSGSVAVGLSYIHLVRVLEVFEQDSIPVLLTEAKTFRVELRQHLVLDPVGVPITVELWEDEPEERKHVLSNQ
jgi:hypothetical protein